MKREKEKRGDRMTEEIHNKKKKMILMDFIRRRRILCLNGNKC
jgi:hypothetical protein